MARQHKLYFVLRKYKPIDQKQAILIKYRGPSATQKSIGLQILPSHWDQQKHWIKDKYLGNHKNLLAKLKEYRDKNFRIVIFTSRNMRTFKNDIKKIKENTLPNIKEWLNKHKVPYDEIIVGKPWCGENGFYIDDKALRPDEFLTLDNNSIKSILKIDNN